MIDGNFLIQHGWSPGPHFKEAISEGNRLYQQGVTAPQAILAGIQHLKPAEPNWRSLRDPQDSPPLAEAIDRICPPQAPSK